MPTATPRGRTGFPPAVLLLLSVLTLLFLPQRSAHAEILGLSELDMDFTKADDVKAKARWEDTDLFGPGSQGFGRKAGARGGRRVTLRIVEPLALGVWWRPTDNARVRVRLAYAGEHAASVPATVYVRSSCGARHWSEWHHVTPERSDPPKAARGFETTLQVPRKSREGYFRALREWSRTDVPWASDEEAFVTWWKERHPQAFTTSRPFLGYLQFMLELDLPEGTHLTSFEADVTWVVSGVSAIPKDPAVEALQKRRQEEAWSWKADGSHEAETGAAPIAADEKAVFETALRYLIADAEQEGAKRGSAAPYRRVVVQPTTAGAMDLITLPRITFEALRTYFGKLERSLAQSFEARARRLEPLPMGLDPGVEVIYVGVERTLRMRLPHGPYNWKRHRALWPNSFGRVTLSSPGFSEDGSQALVHVGRMYGHLAGNGTLVRLEKRDGTWHVVETRRTWVS